MSNETKQAKPSRNNGSYAIDVENKKISISTGTGKHSILFEDIASTSYSTIEGQATMKMESPAMLGGGILMFAVAIGMFTVGEEVALGGSLLIIVGLMLCAKAYKVIPNLWDNVTIESRGGKKVTYSVDQGQGQTDMDSVEEARRAK